MPQRSDIGVIHTLQDFHLRIQEDLHRARLHVQALELIDQDLSALTERLKALEGGPGGPPFGLGDSSSEEEGEVWAVLQEVDEDGNPVEDEVRSAVEVIRPQADGEGAILDDFGARADFGPLH